MNNLNRFQIFGLYGTRNIDIKFKNNTIILVGENGLGKTTILKFICAILSGTYHQVPSHMFEKIIVTIGKKDFTVTYEDIHGGDLDLIPNSARNLPLPIRQEIAKLRNRENKITRNDLVSIAKKHGYPVSLLLDRLISTNQINLFDENEQHLSKIPTAINAKIIYLPTYRRIEEDLSNVIKGRYSFSRENNERHYSYSELSDINANGYIELVEFGMQDVKEKIEERCLELSRFSENSFKNLAYKNLGDVINKNYHSAISNTAITAEEIEKFKLCLSRSNDEMLSENQVKMLIETVTSDRIDIKDTQIQILLYYFRNLLALQRDLEDKEQSIVEFCEICNKYLSSSNKIVKYDISTFKIQILKQRNNAIDIIDMSDLSSGEKQIVSLFCHLYLAENKSYFVIIDEPELSLSVPWQKIFVEDIKNSALCNGIIAATHSPFIYDNDLLPFTHGLDEFICDGE
ncbi:MAG: AAA family ATPase [Bacilli bacterium]|uniref:AAA family ATPase n=1 Tax=Anaerorhabdus sp. TaxID=1872524 RepID=UPI002FC885BD